MITTDQASHAVPETSFLSIPHSLAISSPASVSKDEIEKAANVVLPIATASLAAHLLAIAFLGAGVALPVSQPRRATLPPPPASVIEEIKIEEPPPLPPQHIVKQELTPAPEAPEPAVPLNLPQLPPIQAIAAVPSTIPVPFGLEAKGPVRLVANAAQANGSVGSRRRAEPVSLDLAGSSERNLLLPAISYPADAKRRRITGQVLVEFHTSPTGEIYEARVNQSSGHASLDQAALENLRQGRWSGEPGFYVKAYEFSLR